jgi:hypothetical protein
MAQENSVMLAVIMERKTLDNKWASHHWEAIAVVPDNDPEGAAPRRLIEEPATTQWLFPGLELRLYSDEAENYLLNVGAPEPRVFVMWRPSEMAGEVGLATPQRVTVSYGEAARMMDSGEQVDGVPLPDDLLGWIEDFARGHYRPPEKKQKGKRYASSKPGVE